MFLIFFIIFIIGIVAIIKGGLPKLKIPNRKIAIIVTIVAFIMTGITVPKDNDNEQESIQADETEQQELEVDTSEESEKDDADQEDVLTFEGELDLEVKDDKIIMTVTSNVPDGGLFELSILNNDLEAQSDIVPIENGKIIHEFTIPKEWGIGYISGLAMFRFNLEEHPQPDHIKEIYGEVGEKMEGNLVVDNNLDGKNANIENVVIAYPSEEAVAKENKKIFDETLNEMIELTDGIIIDVKPIEPNNWEIVYVIVSDAWYYSPDHEKERFAEQVGEAVENLVLSTQMTDNDFVNVYFHDEYGKELASPKIFGGYKIKR